jgi:hypothetical protein
MDFNSTIEQHEVTVPSKGLLYGDKMPDGKVAIVPWTIAQEEILIRQAEMGSADLMHQLLRNNVLLPNGMQYEDLLTTDRFFLLVQVRCISLLSTMILPSKCPKCNHEHLAQVNLQQMPCKVPDEIDILEEPVELLLPKSKVTVSLRYRRVSDEIQSEKYASKKPGSKTAARAFLYARQISEIDGKSVPFDEKLEFVHRLVSLDLTMITDRLAKLSTGYTGRAKATCPECSHVDEMWEPPLHFSFFRLSAVDIESAAGNA